MMSVFRRAALLFMPAFLLMLSPSEAHAGCTGQGISAGWNAFRHGAGFGGAVDAFKEAKNECKNPKPNTARESGESRDNHPQEDRGAQDNQNGTGQMVDSSQLIRNDFGGNNPTLPYEETPSMPTSVGSGGNSGGPAENPGGESDSDYGDESPAYCRKHPELCQFRAPTEEASRPKEPQGEFDEFGLPTAPSFSGGSYCHDGRGGARGIRRCRPGERSIKEAVEEKVHSPWGNAASAGGGGPGRGPSKNAMAARANIRPGASAFSGVDMAQPGGGAGRENIHPEAVGFEQYQEESGGLLSRGEARAVDPVLARKVTRAIQQADTLALAGNWREAARHLEQAVAMDPTNVEAFVKLSQIYNKLHDYEAAQKAAEAAIENDPAKALAYENLSWAQLNRRNFKDALNSAQQASRLYPKSGWAHVLQAMAHEQNGDQSQMISELETAADLDAVFFGHLLRARANKRLFNPNGNNDFLQDGIPYSAKKGSIWKFLGALAVILGLMGLIWWKFSHVFIPLQTAMERALERQMAAKSTQQKQAELLSEGGVQVGKYELSRIIGKGGMGVVWEARDSSLDRRVAIKKITSELGEKGSSGRDLFVKEAKTVAALHHPDIVEIYDVLDTSSGLYLVFELIEGRTLRQILEEQKKLPLASAAAVLTPVCRALDFAHNKGYVHRDLKPSNVMIDAQGHAKVMDFGIARAMQERRMTPNAAVQDPAAPTERTADMRGTPLYMAPETAQGLITPLADVYALGICLYELLTGERPYGQAPAHVSTHLEYVKASERVAGLPPQVDALIARALAPRKEDRFQSIREFYSAMAVIPGAGAQGVVPTA